MARPAPCHASLIAVLLVAGPAAAADYPCLIEPNQVLKLAAAVPGVVSSVDVRRGDRVKKGQVVARLESDVEEANAHIAHVRAANDTAVQSGQARVEFLKRKQGRNEQLRVTDAVSFAQLDEATADARVAEAQLREAGLNLTQAKLEAARAEGLLRQRRVVSPVDGVVTERALGPGEFRNDQAYILVVAETNPLRVETYLPIALHGHVRVGDKVEVLPEAPVGGAYEATVTVVDSVYNAASGTIGVQLLLPNPDARLPAGLHCTVRITERDPTAR